MMFTDQTMVTGRHLHYRRSLFALELSVVSYLLGKTKVEKKRICGNYVSLFPGRDECLRAIKTLKETTGEIFIRVFNPVAHVSIGSGLKMRHFIKLY